MQAVYLEYVSVLIHLLKVLRHSFVEVGIGLIFDSLRAETLACSMSVK